MLVGQNCKFAQNSQGLVEFTFTTLQIPVGPCNDTCVNVCRENLQCSYGDSPYMLISLHPSMSFSPSTSSCLWLAPVTVPLRTAYQRLQRDFQLSFICMCVLLLFKHPVSFRDAAPSRGLTIQPRTELTNPSVLYIVMLQPYAQGTL